MDRRLVAMLDQVSKNLDGKDKELLADLVQLTNGEPEKLLSMLQELAGSDWRRSPVDMETFLLHKDYLGLQGQIFPVLVDDLSEMFSGQYYEGVLTGGIGWGKSTMAECALVRMVYEASCLKDPAVAYGLMPGTKIAFVNASVSMGQATNVVFHGIKNKIRNSPYFRESFAFDAELKKELRFPNDIWIAPLAASEGGTVGYNIFGGVLDEVNFWDVTEKSQQARGGKFDQARTVYNLMMRRIKSRFVSGGGKLPGLLLQVSSSKYPDDFTEQRIQETRELNDETTFVRRYSTWTTRPRDKYSPENFYLYRGTTADRPAISKNKIDLAEKDQRLVLEVPMDWYTDFAKDIDGSIRDLAGYPTLSIKPFIPQRDKIMAAIERGNKAGMKHPYTVDVTNLEDGASFVSSKVKFNPGKWYFAHVDIGLKKDGCGLAVGHIDGWTKITHRVDGKLVEDVEPIIAIDFMIRIVAPMGGEVQIDYVRALLLHMRSMGCNFKKITYDQYQSAQSIQGFIRMGIDSEKMSVDRPMDAYNAFKEAFLEDRINIYGYEPFVEEVVRLEYNEEKDKVDHPPKGSKDITDAVAGVVYHCVLHKHLAMVDPSYGYSVGGLVNINSEGWQVPFLGEATVDDKGVLKPGKKLRTEDDILFGQFNDDNDDGGFIGFA